MLTLLILLLGASTFTTPAAYASSPSKRMGHAMIYDPMEKRVLMFGGSMYTNNYVIYNELWSFDLNDYTWSLIETGLKPTPRFHHSMAYIPDTHQIFLFGGWGPNDKIGDTWIYDIAANEWRQLQPRDSPDPRSSSTMAYDTANKVVVLFGGYGQEDTTNADTWIYDFTQENWIEMNPETRPLRQYGSGMVYDTVNEKLLLYPGHWSISQTEHGYGDQIWVYDYPENTWSMQSTEPKPQGRYWFHQTYVTSEAAFILNGGTGIEDEPCSEVWLYRYAENSWELKTIGTAPDKRSSSSMCYDPDTEKIVLFGGADVNVRQLDDTWILSTETWTWEQISGEPHVESPTESTDTENESGISGYPYSALIIGLSLYVLIKMRKASPEKTW